tara:strand:+ start:414 stop:800 length:387 start_codon:yes stop_codon:yes gene_type:complete
MATNAKWTVVFEDKMIIKRYGDASQGIGHVIEDDSFWNQSKFSNIWAIQYVDDNLDYNDTVEYRDEAPHTSWNNAGLGDFSPFISKWDSAHLPALQSSWDDNRVGAGPNETEVEKITRLGARPTSYSS